MAPCHTFLAKRHCLCNSLCSDLTVLNLDLDCQHSTVHSVGLKLTVLPMLMTGTEACQPHAICLQQSVFLCFSRASETDKCPLNN